MKHRSDYRWRQKIGIEVATMKLRNIEEKSVSTESLKFNTNKLAKKIIRVVGQSYPINPILKCLWYNSASKESYIVVNRTQRLLAC